MPRLRGRPVIAPTVGRMLVRDLGAVRREIEAYEDEADLWKLVPGLRNSAGNLALHVAGNLAWFVGATLGGTGYVRDRAAEFSRRHVPRTEIVAAVDAAAATVGTTLDALPERTLGETYPLELGGLRVATGDFLLHLAVHLGYHLGQIDYHRRFLTGQAGEIGAVAITGLPSARPFR